MIARRWIGLSLGVWWISAASGCGAAPSGTATAGARSVVTAPSDPCADAPAPAVDLGFRCVAGGAGSWRIELEGVGSAPCQDCYREGELATEGTYRFVYVRSDGDRAVGAERAFHLEEAQQLRVEILAVHDFDGDGASELALKIVSTMHEGGDALTTILTASGPVAIPYAPAEAFASAIAEVRDVDGDGVPDVVSHLPWSVGGFGFSEGGGGWSAGPRSLFHALPDGSFSRLDEVAGAFVATECGGDDALVPPLVDPDDPGTYEAMDRALRNVTCAALRTSEAEALARFEAEWRRAPCTFDDAQCVRLAETLRQRIHAAAR